jgi:hypothetical protein
VTPVLAGGAIGGAAGAIGWVAAAATAPSTDYAGIALIIGAASTFVGTVGGLIIALRRSNSISRAEAVALVRELREEGKHDHAS